MSDPIVISGIGIASPLGLGRRAHWDALVGDVSALEPFALEVADPLPVHGGARMRHFDVAPFLKDRKMARLLGRASAFGYAATHLALEDADDVFAGCPPERRGLFCQTGMFQVEGRDLAPIVEHCCDHGELSLSRFGEKGMSVINPFLPIKTLPNMGLGALSIAFDIQGPNLVTGPFAGQGATLLALAAAALRNDEADVCVVAGGDAPFSMMTLSSLLAMNALNTSEQPTLGLLSPDNAGLVLGEGGVALVLERESRARERLAPVYARLGDWAMEATGQPRHGAATDAGPSARVLAAAAGDHRIGAVVAEANGLVDALERPVLETYGPYIYGSKPQVGAWIGASFLLDVAHAALGVATGNWLRPSLHVLVHGLDLAGVACAWRLDSLREEP